MITLNLSPVTPDVYDVQTAEGLHVGNLKRVGAVWKFKALGYDAVGQVEPGGGPLTGRHNLAFAAPDAAEVNRQLLG